MAVAQIQIGDDVLELGCNPKDIFFEDGQHVIVGGSDGPGPSVAGIMPPCLPLEEHHFRDGAYIDPSFYTKKGFIIQFLSTDCGGAPRSWHTSEQMWRTST